VQYPYKVLIHITSFFKIIPIFLPLLMVFIETPKRRINNKRAVFLDYSVYPFVATTANGFAGIFP